jgi:hypothetical protein
MTSNITMTFLVVLYFGITAYGLVAFQAHRHSAAAAVASLNLPR